MLVTYKVEYKIKSADKNQIMHHLEECNNSFVPLLSERVDIAEYSAKIADKAVTFEAWEKNKLVGLVAAYINKDLLTVFITNVSVLKQYAGKGIAKQLMVHCIEYVGKNSFKNIQLEVSKNNTKAISLYKGLNFIEYGSRGETLLMELKTE